MSLNGGRGLKEMNRIKMNPVLKHAADDCLEHHGILGQRWGKRNGPPYPLDSSQLSDKVRKLAEKKESVITNDVLSAFKNAGCSPHGLENKLKTKESIKRKIETNSIEDGTTPYESAKGIKDAVRYTSLSNDNDFTSNYFSVKDSLSKLGYKETRCKNYFDLYNKGLAKHKSVQSIFEDESGYKFEIQFQTKASQKAKDRKVPIYEERRNPNVSKKRAVELEAIMDKLAKEVPTPKNVYEIKSH